MSSSETQSSSPDADASVPPEVIAAAFIALGCLSGTGAAYLALGIAAALGFVSVSFFVLAYYLLRGTRRG